MRSIATALFLGFAATAAFAGDAPQTVTTVPAPEAVAVETTATEIVTPAATETAPVASKAKKSYSGRDCGYSSQVELLTN